MATRESLSKLNLKSLQVLATEHNILYEKKKKEKLVSELLEAQIPSSVLTPVLRQTVTVGDVTIPGLEDENLPPFNRVNYEVYNTSRPLLTFSNIYEYMIKRPTFSGTTTQNFKGLDRAVKHYEAGDVQEVCITQISTSISYFKAMVLASMKKQRYQVYVCILDKGNREMTIQYGYCQCPVGLAQTCSHIGSLLFALSSAKGYKGSNETESPTDKICGWKIPRQSAKPMPMSNLVLENKSSAIQVSDGSYVDTVQPKDKQAVSFDPRHSLDRHFDVPRALDHLRTLKEVFPNTGMSCLWNIPDTTPDISGEVEMETWIDPLQKKMEEMVFTKNNLPPPSIETNLINYIEKNTKSQRASQIWRDLHRGRITSSMFGDVMAAGSNPKSLIRQITEGSCLERYSSLPKPVKWGIDNEEKARAQYVVLNSIGREDFTVETAGLTLNSIYSFLGATSDGLVYDGESRGLLEIKCPYSLEGTCITTAEIESILEMNSPNFCLIKTSNGPSLNPKHKYFAQVQGEMALKELPWCDFVVWTNAEKNNICVDRVYFDAEYVKNMLNKLVQFYMEHIFPIYYHT